MSELLEPAQPNYEAAKDIAWAVLSFDDLGDDEAVAVVYDIVDAALEGLRLTKETD